MGGEGKETFKKLFDISIRGQESIAKTETGNTVDDLSDQINFFFFFHKMYSPSLELKNKSMYKQEEFSLPSPTRKPLQISSGVR